MEWRNAEMAAFGDEVVRLDRAEALTVSRRAFNCCSKTRYGLDESVFKSIDRLDVNDHEPEARQWLVERIGTGDLFLVFAKNVVFRLPASLFLDQWRDMFCPSRDDVVILPAAGGWVLFYCHEDEFEFARGGPAD